MSFDAINTQNIISAALSCRAHLEVTGVIAHILYKYNQTLKENISRRDFHETVAKLSLGVKDKSIVEASFDPINALTLIDSVDRLIKPNYVDFRKAYDILSEFCHPNSIGNLMMSKNVNGQFTFKESKEPYESDSKYFLDIFFLSCSLYTNFYFELLEKLEEYDEPPFVEYKKIMEYKNNSQKEDK